MSANYDAIDLWDKFIFRVAHGDDPVVAFNEVLRGATGILGEERWDDMKSPATAINPPGQASDPGVEASSGLLLFDATGIELVYILDQMPHAWKEGSNIVPHVHWTKTSSASGDVSWNLKYKKAPIGEVMDTNWTDLGVASSTVEGTPDTNTNREHLITSWGEQTFMADNQISDCILWELSRRGSDGADTYGADARLLEFDVHYQLDSNGSFQQFIKAPA